MDQAHEGAVALRRQRHLDRSLPRTVRRIAVPSEREHHTPGPVDLDELAHRVGPVADPDIEDAAGTSVEVVLASEPAHHPVRVDEVLEYDLRPRVDLLLDDDVSRGGFRLHRASSSRPLPPAV